MIQSVRSFSHLPQPILSDSKHISFLGETSWSSLYEWVHVKKNERSQKWNMFQYLNAMPSKLLGSWHDSRYDPGGIMPRDYARKVLQNSIVSSLLILEMPPERWHLGIVWKSVVVKHKHAKGCSKILCLCAMNFQHLEHIHWSCSIYQYRSILCLTDVILVIFSEVRFQQSYEIFTWEKAAALSLVSGGNDF